MAVSMLRDAGMHAVSRWIGSKNFRTYFHIVDKAPAIPALEGLRALAIVLVLGRHAVHEFTTDDHAIWSVGSWNATSLLANGWMGVDLFFVLSGFLIFHHLIRSKCPAVERGAWLRRFFKKRALRIMPVYWAMVPLIVFGVFPGFVPSYESHGHLLIEAVAIHALFLSDLFGSGFVVGMWSLGVEEKFYLLAPFLFIAIMRVRILRWRVAVLCMFAVSSLILRLLMLGTTLHDEMSYGEFFWTMRAPFYTAMEGLMLGAAIAMLYNDQEFRGRMVDSRVPQIVGFLGWGFIGISLFAYPIMGRGNWSLTAIHLSLLALAFAAIVFSILFRPSSRSRWLQSHSAMYLSKLSYSLYLIHQPLIPLTVLVLGMLLPFHSLDPAIKLLVFIVPYFAMSIAGALLMHLLVEKPFLRLKDRL